MTYNMHFMLMFDRSQRDVCSAYKELEEIF